MSTTRILAAALFPFVTSLLVGCAGADGSDTATGEDAVKNQDKVASLAKQLDLGPELASPVPTMRQFGTSGHVNRITTDAYGNVLSVWLDATNAGGVALDGVPLAAVQAFGLRGYPMMDSAMGGKLGWIFDNGDIAMDDPTHACDFTGEGPQDPGYPKCMADAKAQLASRTPNALGSSAGVVTGVTIHDTAVPLAAVYLAYNHRAHLGTYEGKNGPTYKFTTGRIVATAMSSKTITTAMLDEGGRTTNVEMCSDDGQTISCQYIPHGR